MFLKKIELQGFKSFPNKVIFEVNNGITGIVGPNGSGKSNIVDAIRWVLGEQSMKTLRGSKMEDIIFNGTQARKPLGFAEINLIIDNSLGTLPINYTEVVVTRRVYRSGESEFFINKSQCRLKDINEMFMGTGVGRDGYSIIGQGRIDELLSNKPEDRRNVFEEATGIMKYKVRKNESEKKLEDTKNNLLRINDIINELEVQISPLEQQSSKAKKYLELKENLKKLDIALFVENVNEYKVKLQDNQKDINNIIEQIKDSEEKFNEKQFTKQQQQKEFNQLQEQIDIEIFKNSDILNKIEKNNSEIEITSEKIKNNNQNYERLELEIVEYEEKILTLKSELENKKIRLLELIQEKEKFDLSLNEKEFELSQIGENIEKEREEIEDIEAKIESYSNQLNELKLSVSNYTTILETNNNRKNKIEIELNQLIIDKDKHNMKIEDINNDIRELNQKILNQTEEISNFTINKQKLENFIKDYRNKLDKINQEINIKKSKYKFLNDLENQHEGYLKSVKSILNYSKNKELHNIHGALVDLIRVPKKYEFAIEIALGFALQNIVTDDEEAAKKAIDILKRNNLGRATFLPLTTIMPKKYDFDKKLLSSYDGYIGVASELIKFDDKYKNIVDSLLAKIIIVDNLDSGIYISKKLKYSIKIVTLQGDIINPSGSMTGGSIETKGTGILGRGREIEELKETIIELQSNYENINSELANYLKEYENYDKQFSEMNETLQTLQIMYVKENEQVVNIKNIIELLEEKIINLKKEQDIITEDCVKFLMQIEEGNRKIFELQENLKLQDENYNNFGTKFEQKYEEKAKIYDDITNIKISLSSIEESINSLNMVIGMLEKDITSSNLNINKRKENKERIIVNNEIYENSIKEINLKIVDYKNSIQDTQKKLVDFKLEKDKIFENLNILEEQIMTNFKNIELLKSENNRLELKKSKISNSIEELQNKMWDEYEITLLKAMEYKVDSIDASNFQKEANKLRNEIKLLGSINIDSIDEYIKVKERYEFLLTQRNDLERAEVKLRKVISEMLSVMKKQFEERFKVISNNFDSTFKELFNGGKANLKLSDENNILESAIDIEVQPPGKRLQNLMSLSGGERAFTAIALLFAIFKINPSPFCVLDEIEAALDESNVFRFADYIKKFSDETQFLVITHRKGTMEIADTLYGVTMEEKGVSKLVSMKLA